MILSYIPEKKKPHLLNINSETMYKLNNVESDGNDFQKNRLFLFRVYNINEWANIVLQKFLYIV